MALAEATTLTEVPEWTFGERLRKARRHVGLNQQAMADALGVKVQRYSNWEADANLPRQLFEVCTQVERISGFPADWLAGFRTGSFSPSLVAVPLPSSPDQMQFPLDAAAPALSLVPPHLPL